MTANGRFNKLTIQGGVSAGRRLTDNCEVRAKVPEAALATVIGLPSPLTTPYCLVSEPMLTQVKGSASYVLPWYDVRVSGTLQSVTGPVVAANNNAFNSDAILSQQDNYGVAWQNATSVIQPRFVKFQVRWDF